METVVLARHTVHALMGADPMVPAEAGSLVYFPSPAGARALAAANVVVAEDVTDPTRTVAFRGVAADPLPGGIPLGLVVELDFDSDELPWLVAVLRWLNRELNPTRPE